MLCKGYRTTFGTPLMWLILNLFFGPFLTVPFIIGAFVPGKKKINPIDMKLNFSCLLLFHYSYRNAE